MHETIIESVDFLNHEITQHLAERINSRGRAKGGLITLINRKTSVLETRLVNNKFCIATIIKNKGICRPIIIINTYLPPTSDKENIKYLFSCIASIKEQYAEHRIIVIGDFNARIGESGDDIDTVDLLPENIKRIRKSMDTEITQRGRYLLRQCYENNMIILNGRVNTDAKGEFTFIGGRGSSVIDLALVSEDLLEDISIFKTINTIHSQHLPILLQLGTKTKESNNPVYKLQWRDCKLEEYQDLITKKCADQQIISYEMFVHIINSVASRLQMINTILDTKDPLWFDKECKYLKQSTEKKKKELGKASAIERDAILTDYITMKAKYNRTIKNKKVALLEKQRVNINNINNPMQFWNQYKNLKRKPACPCYVEEEQWMSYYNGLMPRRLINNIILSDTTDDILDKEISFIEVYFALRQLANNKAPGPDKISNEFLKNLSTTGIEYLTSLFNYILTHENIPKGWTESETIMIFKKGDEYDPNNYRPISLLNTTLKLFTQILADRITKWSNDKNLIPEAQAGFRKGRGCEDQIFVLNSAIQIAVNSDKKKMFTLFIDFARAFPSISHSKLWSKLDNLGMSSKIIRILQYLYGNSKMKIRIGSKHTKEINITEGLLQGETLSPLLFSLFISDIESILQTSILEGLKIGKQKLHILLFADDMVLIALTANSLQLKINLLEKYFSRNGLTVHLDKTKVVIFQKGGRRAVTPRFTYNKSVIEIVNEYVYLGIPFYSSCCFKRTAELYKSKGMKALQAIWNIFYRGSVNEWTSHKKLFDAVVKSTALYCSHIWAIKYTDIIERIQSKFIKRLFQLKQQTASYIIRLETGTLKLEVEIMQRLIKFLQKITTADHSRYTRSCYEELQRLAAKGITRYNWFADVQQFLEKRLQTSDINSIINGWKDYKKIYIMNLWQQDMDSAYASERHHFLHCTFTGIIPQQYLNLNLPLQCMRIICQLRINGGFFYYKLTSFDFNTEENCNLCNLNEIVNLKHILYNCTMHSEIRNSLCKVIHEFNDEDFNLVTAIQEMDKNKIMQLYHFIIALLAYRQYIAHLEVL